MSWYRRRFVPGGTFFFTVAVARRGSSDLLDHVDALRDCYARCAREHPFRTDAIVILPDHLHAVWTLPEGDSDFSGRWRRIKAGVSRRVGESPRVVTAADGSTRGLSPTLRRSASKARKGEAGFWQRRFWGEARPEIGPVDRSQRRTGEAPAAQRGCIRDEAELAACLCYVWGNPVKHGLVERAVDWPYSSVHGEVRSGRLPGERV